MDKKGWKQVAVEPGETFVIRMAEVKLDQEDGESKILTMQSSSLTDQLRPGARVQYRRRLYTVQKRWKPEGITTAIIQISLKPLKKGGKK